MQGKRNVFTVIWKTGQALGVGIHKSNLGMPFFFWIEQFRWQSLRVKTDKQANVVSSLNKPGKILQFIP